MLVKNVIGMSWKQEQQKNNIGYLLMKNGKAADSKESIIGNNGPIAQLIKILQELKRVRDFYVLLKLGLKKGLSKILLHNLEIILNLLRNYGELFIQY